MMTSTQSGTAWTLIALVAAVSACDASAELPRGWSAAHRISGFTQMQCSGSQISGPPETLKVAAVADGIAVDYDHAPFDCGQDVEGFLRRTGPALDVLVQPIDRHPTARTRCGGCLYQIKATLDVKPGSYTVSVYRRGDAVSGPDDPTKVGSIDVVYPAHM